MVDGETCDDVTTKGIGLWATVVQVGHLHALNTKKVY